ncbi:hypothetical protein [Burkholderia pseudomultivorans]|nr:hypothetical protein [Burkholderia pseudomultivorans]
MSDPEENAGENAPKSQAWQAVAAQAPDWLVIDAAVSRSEIMT